MSVQSSESNSDTNINYCPLIDNNESVPISVSDERILHTTLTSVMALICRLIAILIILHVTYFCFDDVTLFSAHPACMTMGYLLFMLEAILSLTKERLQILKNVPKTTVHWILQVIATSLISIGFLSIVLVKFTREKPHFHTWHSIIGLIAVISVIGTNVGGTAALYSSKFKNFIKSSLIKTIHASFGVLSFFLGVIALILGFYSNWFTSHANKFISFMYSVLILVVALNIVLNPVKNISARLKSK